MSEFTFNWSGRTLVVSPAQVVVDADLTLPTLQTETDQVAEIQYERHYTHIDRFESSVRGASCSPITPVSVFDGYTEKGRRFQRELTDITNGIRPTDLRMGPLGRKLNSFISLLRGMPDQFCIGPANKGAFEQMKNTLDSATNAGKQGVSKFERHLQQFSNGSTPLLGELRSQSRAINDNSRDFRAVMSVLERYRAFAAPYKLEVWRLSDRIHNLATALGTLENETDVAFKKAIGQIEANVGIESEKFARRLNELEAAKARWDTEDGKLGYDAFKSGYDNLQDHMLPDFVAFLGRVPGTDRINAHSANARQAIQAVEALFKQFPNFARLPGAASDFPYNEYGESTRKHGTNALFAIVRSACVNYRTATGKTLYVGDLSYAHGGRAKPHKSHRVGVDADVDPVEVGNVGEDSFSPAKALVAAKAFLQAGPAIIFYGHQATVDAANTWAAQQGITGRLAYESDHKKHFHLRD